VLLLRVKAVALDVGDVVPEVHRPRQATEADERKRGAHERPRLEEVLREKERGEDEEVLRPLVRPQGADERHHGVS
jgi:hypothetical protein